MLEIDDALIVAAYQPPYRHGAAVRLAREHGVPPKSIYERARKLGLGKPAADLDKQEERRMWSTEETTILKNKAHLRTSDLRVYLKRKGFIRSCMSIEKKRHRMGWKDSVDRDEDEVGYTAVGLGKLLKVRPGTVVNWIRSGWLKATQESGEKAGNKHRIQRADLRRFLFNYVQHWEPARVDKYWLMDLLQKP